MTKATTHFQSMKRRTKNKTMSKKSKSLKTKKIRYEEDVFGKIPVPKTSLWGATTQRSLVHFSISNELMPVEFIHAYALFKKCAAKTNYKLKLLSKKKMTIITHFCNEILKGKYDNQFPLHIWQTGSGTQTNMNLNEVIANLCNKKLTGKLGTKTPVHPNNDVNLGQSSNDSFITAMHIYIAMKTTNSLIPALEYMIKGFKEKQHEFRDVVKLGRTHLEDAVPLTFGQEFSGYVSLLENSLDQIKLALQNIYKLASGGTAVGTGINTDPRFGKMVAREVYKETKIPFTTAENKYAQLSSHNAVLEMSDATKVLATNIMKIANDIRWAGSGPRAGLDELLLPQNEPGSSIMPGKVNPTQCEAAAMVSVQVMANNLAITISNSQGNFELNVFNPVMLYNMSQSMNILTDMCTNFTKYCVLGLKVNREKITDYVKNALTVTTILNPYIGYDKATQLAHYAYEHNVSLSEANKVLKFLPDDQLQKYLGIKTW